MMPMFAEPARVLAEAARAEIDFADADAGAGFGFAGHLVRAILVLQPETDELAVNADAADGRIVIGNESIHHDIHNRASL